MRIDYILGQSTAHCATINTDMGWIRSRMDILFICWITKSCLGRREKTRAEHLTDLAM